MPPRGPEDDRPEIELLDDGREQLGGATTHPAVRRAVTAAALVAVLVAAVVTLRSTAQRPTDLANLPEPSASASTRGPSHPAEPLRLLDDQYAFTTEGHLFTLQLSVINYGAEPLQVLLTRIPQAGTRPTNGPGGDLPFSSPVTLAPGVPAWLDVSARATCPAALLAPLADHVDVTVGTGGHPQRVVALPLAPLGTTLDDARHQACGELSAAAAVYPTMPASQVRVVVPATGTRGQGRPGVIESALVLTNLTAHDAQVLVLGALPGGLTVERGDADRDAYPVGPRAQATLLLRWTVHDCVAVRAVQWPELRLRVSIPTSVATLGYGFDEAFGAAWRAALATICPGPTS